MKKIAIVLFVASAALAGCGKKTAPAAPAGGDTSGSATAPAGDMGSDAAGSDATAPAEGEGDGAGSAM
jgi:hypothetical protein